MIDRAFDAVIFDLDGVITDTAEFHYLAWQAIADTHGHPFDRAANEALRGLSREESLRQILAGTELSDEEFADLLREKNEIYLRLLDGMGPADMLAGAGTVIDEVKRRGCAVAVGSSSKNAITVLAKLGLADVFDAVADGTSSAAAKPDPGIFLAAATALAVPAGRCVVVEDAASGVDAARAAGMRSVGIGPAQRVGHADLRFDSTAEIDVDVLLAPS